MLVFSLSLGQAEQKFSADGKLFSLKNLSSKETNMNELSNLSKQLLTEMSRNDCLSQSLIWLTETTFTLGISKSNYGCFPFKQ